MQIILGYFIVLIVLVFGVFVAKHWAITTNNRSLLTTTDYTFDETISHLFMYCIFWPLMLPVFLVAGFGYVTYKALDVAGKNAANKIVKMMERNKNERI